MPESVCGLCVGGTLQVTVVIVILIDYYSKKNTALNESTINSFCCVNKMLMIECMSFVVDMSWYICEERHLTNANKLSSLKLTSEYLLKYENRKVAYLIQIWSWYWVKVKWP